MEFSGLILVFVFAILVPSINGHGYLINPAQRSSAWRVGYKTPANYNDMELFCGGFARQWNDENDGKCGACGDPFDASVKPNEDVGGTYVTGTITGSYVSGGEMSVKVKLTAYHMGWFEFRLCKLDTPNTRVTQECLDQTMLWEKDTGYNRIQLEGRKVSHSGTGDYEIVLQLPEVTCENCVLQWWYNTGNSWGCDNTGCGLGKGKQETFKNCADIEITGNNNKQPSTSSSTSTTAATTTTSSSLTTEATTTTTTTSSSSTTEATTTTTTSTLADTTASPTTTAATETSTSSASSSSSSETTTTTTGKSSTLTVLTTCSTSGDSKSTTTTNHHTSDPSSSSTTTEATATTTTKAKETTTTGSSKSSCTCAVTKLYKTVPGMKQWCCDNCAAGFCPSSHCIC